MYICLSAWRLTYRTASASLCVGLSLCLSTRASLSPPAFPASCPCGCAGASSPTALCVSSSRSLIFFLSCFVSLSVLFLCVSLVWRSAELQAVHSDGRDHDSLSPVRASSLFFASFSFPTFSAFSWRPRHLSLSALHPNNFLESACRTFSSLALVFFLLFLRPLPVFLLLLLLLPRPPPPSSSSSLCFFFFGSFLLSSSVQSG